MKPINFIALSTPFLGISSENPAFVKVALDFGIVGRTGHDLGLTPRLNGKKPLLRLMAMQGSKCHEAVRMFDRHTLYANVVNDGIVPLRTSAMFFLDWMGLSKLEKRRRSFWTGGGVEYEEEQVSGDRTTGISNSTAETAIDRHRSAEGQARPGSSGRRLSVGHPRRSSFHSTNSPTSEKHLSQERDSLKQVETPPRPSSAQNMPAQLVGDGSKSPFETLFGRFKSSPTTPTTATSSGQQDTLSSGSVQQDASENSLASLITFLRPAASKGTSEHGSPSSITTRPLDTLHTYLRARKKPSKTLLRSQTVNSAYNLLQKPIPGYSFLESASDLFNPPVPPETFLMNPSTRKQVIFHDRVYEPGDIPVRTGNIQQEERIARDWHVDISWRKVLVKLDPEAHNNIVVRREFSNAWGWGVVEHLVREHFEAQEVAQQGRRRESGGSEWTAEQGMFSESDEDASVA
ncbi:putative lipase ROG1 [Neolecta irregularis DAH-3]|uniref:Putative lipase ROG1 n=1 Tax=Neolecta irregularis (strain DAH-3) TaxID=1198029 RepID=A0A1U7LJX2_NEOID|nr:putative lipase ROG1 [Neolecta irregularis DAH-3]|eukprot:OLL22955.1 putative lipase ROG1 [Neolecta irregularis DAH-3]